MSDPDQEEIRRKRLARLGGASTNPSQDASFQDQKSQPTETTSELSKDCSADAASSHEAPASSMTMEDVNMQVLGEQKETIKHDANNGTNALEPTENVQDSVQASTVHRSESSTAMDVTFTPSSSPPKPLAAGRTNSQIDGAPNNSSTSQKSQSPILTDFDSGIETMDIDNDPSAQAGSGSNSQNYQQGTMASSDGGIAHGNSSNLNNVERIHTEPSDFASETCPMEKDEQSQEVVVNQTNTDDNIQDLNNLTSKNTPEKRKRTSSSATYDITEDQVLEILQKIFGCKITSKDDKESKNDTTIDLLFLPECCRLITERKEGLIAESKTGPAPKDESLDYNEIVSEILTEVLVGMTKNIYPSKLKIKDAFDVKDDMFKYLVQCYEDVGIEERNNKKKMTLSPLSNAIAASRNGIIMYTCLVCSGTFETNMQSSTSIMSTPIFDPLLKQKLPHGFLIDMINYATAEFGNKGKEIFEPLLRCLVSEARSSNIVELGNYRKALSALTELSDISIEKNRPICQLMTEMTEWLPEEIRTGYGKKVMLP